MAEDYIPDWEGVLEGWTVAYANLHEWRVVPHCSADDLYQDGFVLFLTCRAKYKHIKDKYHFENIYKRSFINHIHDLSKTRTGEQKYKEAHSKEFEDEETASLHLSGMDWLDLDLDLESNECPESLRRVLMSYKNKPEDISGHIDLSFYKDKDTRWRETSVGRLRRIFGSLKEWLEVKAWLRKQQIIKQV